MEHGKGQFEQYCSVVGKNVIMEEQRENGIRKLHCMNEIHCRTADGCKNHYIEGLHASFKK